METTTSPFQNLSGLGFYTQIWNSNPKLYNFLSITRNPGFKFRKNYLLMKITKKKDLQESFNMVQVNMVINESS